jgi:hypothetical protein
MTIFGFLRHEISSGGLNGWQSDDNHRFGVDEGGRSIELEVEGWTLRQGERRNVLVLRGSHQVDDVNHVDDDADVGGVQAVACLGRKGCIAG